MSKKITSIVTVVCFLVLTALSVFFSWQLRETRRQSEDLQKQLVEARAAQASAQNLLGDVQRELEEALRRLDETNATLDELKVTIPATLAKEMKAAVQTGDNIGRVWVEGTNVDCALYWGDAQTQFSKGAGCHMTDGCVLPGENGTAFVGAHTNSYFRDLESAEIGAIIHLDTNWGDFQYRITETRVIEETQVDQCRWGAQEASCILYTCYPFGITVPTTKRYLVYADPIWTDDVATALDD